MVDLIQLASNFTMRSASVGVQPAQGAPVARVLVVDHELRFGEERDEAATDSELVSGRAAVVGAYLRLDGVARRRRAGDSRARLRRELG
jgi:hypothetical protein